jgi:hypothetical protein
VGINYFGVEVFRDEKFLGGSDVVAILEQVDGEGVATGVAVNVSGGVCVSGCFWLLLAACLSTFFLGGISRIKLFARTSENRRQVKIL